MPAVTSKMSALGKKLKRLPAMPGLDSAAGRSSRRDSSRRDPVRPERGPEGIRTTPASPERRSPSIDELRETIARIVGRTTTPERRAPPAAHPADAEASELPFDRVETASGLLHVRRAMCSVGARVGRASLAAAESADSAVLSLLALDPKIADCDPKKALFMDTETTGLAGGTGTVPFLIGLSWLGDDGRWCVEQFLLRQLGQEAPMLELFAKRLAQASMLVTYNGKSFDLPLLRARFVMNRLSMPEPPPHLDLLHVARRVHKPRLRSHTLSAIEDHVLGQVRLDDVAGADIVTVYMHFLRTGDEAALLGVIEHNERDVLSMIALLGLYGEPLGSLVAEDLAGAARAVRRAGQLGLAADFADVAVQRGGGRVARRARGEIAKARGDKQQALADYEAVLSGSAHEEHDAPDDGDIRLELAKLYEHHVRAPARALVHVEAGTSEDDEASEHRRRRLLRKLDRLQQLGGPQKLDRSIGRA